MKISNKKVTILQETACLDGKVKIEQTFDFSNCTEEQLLTWSCAQKVINWRASNSVKGLTMAEVQALPKEIDCSLTYVGQKITKDSALLSKLRQFATSKGISVEKLLEELV